MLQNYSMVRKLQCMACVPSRGGLPVSQCDPAWYVAIICSFVSFRLRRMRFNDLEFQSRLRRSGPGLTKDQKEERAACTSPEQLDQRRSHLSPLALSL